MAKLKTFSGGLHPPDSKRLTAHLPVESCPLPDELVIPLSQHIGAPCSPCVSKGDHVLKGQMIGETQTWMSVPVHASTSGEVIAVESRLHPSGMPLPAVVIRPDGEGSWVDCESVDEEALEPSDILEKIRQAGIAGMGGATFPCHVKLSPPEEKKIDTLILNGVECEPYLTADHRLMLEEGEKVLTGARLLGKLLGVDNISIGIEVNKPDAIAHMTALAQGTGVRVVSLEVKFPQGAEKQLISAIAGREVPSGGLPMDVGAVVQNVGTAAAITDAVCGGKPLVERITTVTGAGISEPKNLRIAIGTSVSHVIDYCGGLQGTIGKIILGGPMMGATIADTAVPVVKGTSGILLLSEDELFLKPEGACIRCARCVLHCPVHLMPTTIASYSRLDMVDEAEQFDALDCIECGCCSYICPAGIPLVQLIRMAKAKVLAKRRRS